MNLITAIKSAVSIYGDAQALGKSLTGALSDPAVKVEVAAHPEVKVIVNRLSDEWRTVENDATAIKKANFLTFFRRVSALLSAAGKLEKDVAAEQHDPAIAAALATMPATLAALSKVSAQWVKVEKDVEGLR